MPEDDSSEAHDSGDSIVLSSLTGLVDSEALDEERDLVFLSCSTQDATWRTKLISASRTDARWANLSWWYPSLGRSADDNATETRAAIREAKAAIILISPAYLDSEYAAAELRWLEEERQLRGLRVIPILLKACDWRHLELLKNLTVRSANRPVADMPETLQNQEFADIVDVVANVIDAEQKKDSPALVLSSSAKAILDAARRLAIRSRRTVISSSCLLFGFAEQAGNSHDTARFVKDALNRTGRYSSLLEDFLKNPEIPLEQEMIPGLDGVFSENARRILEHASLIAQTVSHDSRLIHARHLFAGILAAPVVTFPEARKRLIAIDLDLVALSSEFLNFIRVYAGGDDQDKWRFILGSSSGAYQTTATEDSAETFREVIQDLFKTFEAKLGVMLAASTNHEGEQIRERFEAAKISYAAVQGKAFLNSAELVAQCDEARALTFQLKEIEASFSNMRTVILVANSVAAVLARFAALATDRNAEQPTTRRSEGYVAGTAGYTSEYCGVGTGGDVPDHLGVQGEAQRLAELIALRETKLPLAIGLFGNWGSGKSHFMNLMDRHMDALSKRDEGQWCKQIVPVYFNAWHYSDSNLWASLVTEVFDALFKRLESKADQLALLQERLREAGGVTTLAVEEVESAKQGVQHAEEALASAQKASDHARARLSFIEGLKTLLPELSTDNNRQRVEELLGVSIDTAVIQDLEEKQAELSSLGGRVKELGRRIARPEGRGIRVAYLAGCGLAVLFVRWALGHVPWIENEMRRLGPAAQWLLESLLTLAAWLTPFIGQLRSSLGQLEALQKKAEKAQEEHPAKERVHSAQNDLQQAEERARKAEVAMEAAQVLERQLKSQADQLRPERRLSNFIEARARSADYKGQLGLVSLARRDFEELTRIFTDAEAQERISNTQSPEKKKAEAELSASVDRVVLYIDDLDRCEPEKVVDVLQAVHLLLAYRLFAVVVGVDQRCLKQSLRIRFKGLLTPDKQDHASNHEGLLDAEDIPATPLDYLEKIFHIPFHLPPMGREGFATLVERLTEPGFNSTPVADARAITNLESMRSGYGVRPLDGKTEVLQESASVPETPAAATVSEFESRTPMESRKAGFSSVQAKPDSAAKIGDDVGQSPAEDLKTPTIRRVGSVPLQRWERDALKDYYGLIRTPRGATRLLNTYRLVRAGLPAEEWDRFRCDEGGNGHARLAMLLLAVAAGQPASARTWFTSMRQSGSEDWMIPDQPRSGQEVEWEEFKRLYSSTLKQITLQPDRQLWLDRVERFSF